jgi:hypothetical protein
MSTQVQGLSDNLEEIKSRLGRLNQQLVDLQNTVQSVDAKISGGVAPAGAVPTTEPDGSGGHYNHLVAAERVRAPADLPERGHSLLEWVARHHQRQIRLGALGI